MSARAVIALAIDTAQYCDRLGKTVTQPRGEYKVSEQRGATPRSRPPARSNEDRRCVRLVRRTRDDIQ